MKTENDAHITIPRIVVSLEIIFGLLVPAVVVGPVILLGLIYGIVTAATAPITLLLSAFGGYGLLGTAILLSSSDKISRKRAEIASAGVILGTLAALYIAFGIAKEGRHMDKQTVLFVAVVMTSAMVSLRRVILLWKNPTF